MRNILTGIFAAATLGVGLYVLYWICLAVWFCLVVVWAFFTSRAFAYLLMLVLGIALVIGGLWLLGWCVNRSKR